MEEGISYGIAMGIPIDVYKDLRTKEGVFTESKAVELHADMVTKRKDPSYQMSSDDDIVREVRGERCGWTRAVGQKLPRSIFAKDFSSSSEPKYTQLDVQQILEEYTAPLWSKLAMTPPPPSLPCNEACRPTRERKRRSRTRTMLLILMMRMARNILMTCDWFMCNFKLYSTLAIFFYFGMSFATFWYATWYVIT
uniref:uncharacterized protein LOC122608515 n=1 Tax=Erigeron canadensis TaxID=72917 RepID=UPI001CB8F8A1|nr:uncharacterized protein LOC122608515 [Erigeron canadensis]XP_043637555.1 uncharacterized protein LOC122608515 [Erigeron canadensis]